MGIRLFLAGFALGAAALAILAFQQTPPDTASPAARARRPRRALGVPERIMSDVALAERVRGKLAHMVSQPGAIMVTAQDGRVTLRGPILHREAEGLITRVLAMPGVKEVESQLELHETEAGRRSDFSGADA